MKDKTKRTILAGSMIMLAIVTAHGGLLIPAILLGILSLYVACCYELRFFGDE